MADDPLDNEVSIRASVDQSGLTVAGKSRLLAAIDMLLGAAVDLPGGLLDGIAKRNRLHTAHRARMIEKAAAAIEADDRYLAAEIDYLLRTSGRKYENLLAVTGHAGSAVLALPPPTRPSVDGSSSGDDPSSIQADWLSKFQRYAEDASSERMRELWGRVLAGEARRPGEFSLNTLRAFSEMDQEVAEAFQTVVADRVSERFIPLADELGGEEFARITFLEDIGLLNGSTGFIAMTPKPGEDGYAYIRQGGYALKMKSSERCSVAKLTRVAQEMLTILPSNDGLSALKRLYDLNKDTIYDCVVGAIDAEAEDHDATFVEIERLA